MEAGLLNYVDAGEQRKVMTYALPDGRLTWNVAVAWPEAEARAPPTDTSYAHHGVTMRGTHVPCALS